MTPCGFRAPGKSAWSCVSASSYMVSPLEKPPVISFDGRNKGVLVPAPWRRSCGSTGNLVRPVDYFPLTLLVIYLFF